MIIYVSMLIISLLCAYLSRKVKNTKLQKVFVIGMIIPFIIVSSIRYEVGTDYNYRYVNDFYSISNGTPVENLELGFKLIIKLCLIFTNNSQILFVVTSILINVLIMLRINKNSKNLIFSITLFVIGGFFFQSLNIVRQFLAMSIIFYAHELLLKGKKKFYILFVILAFFIHSSSIIMLILLLLKDKYIFKPKIVIPIIIIIMIFGDWILDAVKPIIEGTRYSVYLVGKFSSGRESILYNVVNLIIYLYMVICYTIKMKKKQEITDADRLYINIQSIALILTVMSSTHMQFARLSYYFTIFQIISIPYFLMTTKISLKHYNANIIRRVICACITLSFLGVIFYTNVIHNDNEPLPYKTIFNKEKEFK